MSISNQSNLYTIEEGAFAVCSELTEITIPSSVSVIIASAFEDSNKLTKIYFKDTTNWWRASYKGAADEVEFSSLELQDAEIAATYLTLTYRYNYWFKK